MEKYSKESQRKANQENSLKQRLMNLNQRSQTQDL